MRIAANVARLYLVLERKPRSGTILDFGLRILDSKKKTISKPRPLGGVVYSKDDLPFLRPLARFSIAPENRLKNPPTRGGVAENKAQGVNNRLSFGFR